MVFRKRQLLKKKKKKNPGISAGSLKSELAQRGSLIGGEKRREFKEKKIIHFPC